VAAREVAFFSSNAWDAHGAAAFGFRVVWVNRFRAPAERLPGTLASTLGSLAAVPPLLDLD
jgi:2-haloacid dehalogenase